MFESLSFVSYRRNDTAPYALALKSELEKRLTNTLVFVDVLRINPADTWPEVLTDSLDRAKSVLVLIGPKWLETSDGDAQPRLFDEEDWVRHEIEFALKADEKIVVPILVGNIRMPRADQIPERIARLLDKQALRLDPANWHQDLSRLSKILASKLDLDDQATQLPWPKPNIIKRRVPLTTQDIVNDVKSEGVLKNWKIELEHNYAGDGTFAEQLVLRVRFRSFPDAMRFMIEFSDECENRQHHPIWENVHRNLTIKFRTFDAGHRVSHFDLEMAAKVNKTLQNYDVEVM